MRNKKRTSKDFDDEEKDVNTWTDSRRNISINNVLSKSINIKCKSEAQKEALNNINDKDISIIVGPPGTGKTYLSCAKALKLIKDESDRYKEIILIKSVNVPKDEEIGYLRGSMEEKMEGYTYPFISNFAKVVGQDAVDILRENNVIKILPIKFALGVTLDNSIIIIDEAQQISKDNLRTLITRIGFGSKMIFLGDVKQKSVNKNKKSALEILMEHFSKVKEIGVTEFTEADVVRHPIIKKLLGIFDEIEKDEGLN